MWKIAIIQVLPGEMLVKLQRLVGHLTQKFFKLAVNSSRQNGIKSEYNTKGYIIGRGRIGGWREGARLNLLLMGISGRKRRTS